MRRPFSVLRHRIRAAEAIALLMVTGVLLRLVPFRRLVSLFGALDGGADGDAPARWTSDPAGVAIALALASAQRRVRHTCLTSAMTGRLMLALRGVPSTLVLGVAIRDGEIAAHAWLACADGMVCGGKEAGGFQVLAAFRS